MLITNLERANLFVQVLRPGDSEWIFSFFDSNCHVLLPV